VSTSEGGKNLAINRWLASVLFGAAATLLVLSTSALAWPCPVDFIASIDDDNNGFVTMISKRFEPQRQSYYACSDLRAKRIC
jgi:hypothetical protein